MKTQNRKDYFPGCDVADFVGGERHGDLSQSDLDTVAVFPKTAKNSQDFGGFPLCLVGGFSLS